jgi:hypothetical protein
MLADVEVDAGSERVDDRAEPGAKLTELASRLLDVVKALHGDVVLERAGAERFRRLATRLEEPPRKDLEMILGLRIPQAKPAASSVSAKMWGMPKVSRRITTRSPGDVPALIGSAARTAAAHRTTARRMKNHTGRLSPTRVRLAVRASWGMQVRCELFRSSMKSWTTLCEEAAAFATQIGRDRLINISVSAAASGGEGVIFVWYWE